MTITQNFLKELNSESVVTRKMLQRIPADKYDWRPHEKSMTIKQLASHIADLPGWVSLAFETDELDFEASPYQPDEWNTIEELLQIFEGKLTGARSHLEKAKDEDLLPAWVLRKGDQILLSQTKADTVRVSLSQTIHHRAQLGVYLRLLDIPLPASYGPSADEPNF